MYLYTFVILISSVIILLLTISKLQSADAAKLDGPDSFALAVEEKIQKDLEVEKLSEEILRDKNIFDRTNNTGVSCSGNWIESATTGNVTLDIESIAKWGADTPPSIISESIQSANTLILGHNTCSNYNCNKAGSEFAKIIELKVGDELSVCFQNKLYRGYILTSRAIDESEISVLQNWTGFPTFTLFTSYGDCKDFLCNASKQRWLVAMEK